MNAGSYKLKLNWSTLWHLFQGGTLFKGLLIGWSISVAKLVFLSDVSKWQGNINWLKMRTWVQGTIIKCGQGGAKDPQFDVNWAVAKNNHVPRGSYWYYDSRVPPKQQAALWWDWTKSDTGELGYWADYEETYGGAWGGHQNLKVFLEELRRLSGGRVKIGIYTGYYYWIAHSPTDKTALEYFAQYPLWLAWYTSNPANVIIPKPWSDLTIWQYGTIPPRPVSDYGVETLEMDSNWFNGDDRAYREYFGLEVPVPSPEPPQVAYVIAYDINGNPLDRFDKRK